MPTTLIPVQLPSDLPPTIYGTSGNDVAVLSASTAYNALGGDDIVYGSFHANRIDAGSGNDLAYGLTGDDIIYGDGGNDILYGGADRDFVSGGLGNDTVDGGSGSDWIEGNGGNDILSDGTGVDTVFGGDGDDLVRLANDGWSQGSDLVVGGLGHDTAAITVQAGSYFDVIGDPQGLLTLRWFDEAGQYQSDILMDVEAVRVNGFSFAIQDILV